MNWTLTIHFYLTKDQSNIGESEKMMYMLKIIS